MDAHNDRRGRRARRDRRDNVLRCPACGGEQKLLVEVPPHGQPHEQDHPYTQYFRCVHCAQVRIVDA